MVDGVMTIGKDENNLRVLDFDNYEDYEAEVFEGKYKVQGMRDGKIYMTELPKRVKNTPIFRDDNCSFSKGKDGKYYFYFQMPEELLEELPGQLVRQASEIAKKVIRGIVNSL